MLWSVAGAVLQVAFAVYWISVLVLLIADRRDPSKTLAWLFLLTVLPGFGLIFYFFFGRNWKKKTAQGAWFAEIRRVAEPTLRRVYERYSADSREGREWSREHGYAHLTQLIETADSAPVLPAYDVIVMPSGAEKFEHLIADFSAAKESINIQYFIWERDELTARLIEVLLGRLADGVEVRVLNDLIGNIRYRKDELARLRSAGAQVRYDVTDLGKANYRNHRKIVVIDGVLGYTGGINVGQEYIDGGKRFDSWRDTHVRFTGPAVAELQRLFAVRWHESTGESLFTETFFPAEYPESGRRVFAQTVSTGVESTWEPARRAHVMAIGLAKDRLWIQSPYFVPDDTVYEAMIDAALSGIDVRFMMTGRPDKRIPWYAAESYLRPVLEAGGRIFYYTAGFFHPKTMTVDGQLLCIGTMNLDVRSLQLHKELMVWFYDPELARQHEAIFEADEARCEEITLERLDGLSRLEDFRDSAARLASNLL